MKEKVSLKPKKTGQEVTLPHLMAISIIGVAAIIFAKLMAIGIVNLLAVPEILDGPDFVAIPVLEYLIHIDVPPLIIVKMIITISAPCQKGKTKRAKARIRHGVEVTTLIRGAVLLGSLSLRWRRH